MGYARLYFRCPLLEMVPNKPAVRIRRHQGASIAMQYIRLALAVGVAFANDMGGFAEKDGSLWDRPLASSRLSNCTYLHSRRKRIVLKSVA
jgi:hypothetical protein